MAFDNVPWAVGAGAQLDAAVARTFVNIATQSTEGINLPGDFKVSALPTPGGQVQIAPGGLTLLNQQAAGQSYIGAAGTVTYQDISPTGGAARSDLIIARVIDPDFSPWQPYTDSNSILNGPYFEPFVVSGVPSTTMVASDVVNYTAYALARIDIPAGTTAITGQMITDLRSLARARTDGSLTVHNTGATQDSLTTAMTGWTDWPHQSQQVWVPAWATHAQIMITLNQVQVDNSVNFNAQVNIGGLTGATANFDYNPPSANQDGNVVGVPFVLAADIPVSTLAGSYQIVKPQAQRTYATTATGNCWLGGGTSPMQQVVFDIRFVERPS